MYARIEPRIVSTDTGLYSNLYVKIEEGTDFHINNIVFKGNRTLTQKQLEGALMILK